MKHIRQASIPLARRRTARAIGDFSAFTTDGLFDEISQLHAVLFEAEQGDGFSIAGRSGLRAVIYQQLRAVDLEVRRRRAGAQTGSVAA